MLSTPTYTLLISFSHIICSFTHVIPDDRINSPETIRTMPSCTNPTRVQLELMILSHEIKKEIEMMKQMNFDYDYSDLLGAEERKKRYVEKFRPMCSMKYSLEKASDTYPFVTLNNKCHAGIVEVSSAFKYECVPFQENKTFLQKGGCMSNGVYEWTPFNKNVTVLCVAKLI